MSAYFRRCAGEGIAAVLRRRGAEDAGAIFIKIDHLDGTASLLAPAPAAHDLPQGHGLKQGHGLQQGIDRLFTRILARVDASDVEARILREIKFDADLWLLEIETRDARSLVDEVALS